MNRDELEEVLRQTMADHALAQAEKKSLSAWLDEHATGENDRALVRSRAFALARSEANAAILDWLEGVVKLTVKPAHTPGGDVVRSTAFFSPGEDCLREVMRQMELARKEVDVCVFTITDDRIAHAIEKVHRRGVRVRIISDDEKTLDLGSDIIRLRQAGIDCRIDAAPGHMHHKFALIDRQRLLTGSFNWTRSATKVNEENLIVTDDAVLVTAFTERFEILWKKLGDPRAIREAGCSTSR